MKTKHCPGDLITMQESMCAFKSKKASYSKVFFLAINAPLSAGEQLFV